MYCCPENFAPYSGYRRHGQESCESAMIGDPKGTPGDFDCVLEKWPESLPCLAVSSIHQVQSNARPGIAERQRPIFADRVRATVKISRGSRKANFRRHRHERLEYPTMPRDLNVAADYTM